jgi:hypothetical protein
MTAFYLFLLTSTNYIISHRYILFHKKNNINLYNNIFLQNVNLKKNSLNNSFKYIGFTNIKN